MLWGRRNMREKRTCHRLKSFFPSGPDRSIATAANQPGKKNCSASEKFFWSIVHSKSKPRHHLVGSELVNSPREFAKSTSHLGWPRSKFCRLIAGWWLTYPSEKYESMGRTIPYTMENKKCSKSPISIVIFRWGYKPTYSWRAPSCGDIWGYNWSWDVNYLLLLLTT